MYRNHVYLSFTGQRTHIHTYKHTYIHTCTPACIHTYLHTYIHSYIHTYKAERNRFLRCFQQLRSYYDERETRNQIETAFSSQTVPKDFSVTENHRQPSKTSYIYIATRPTGLRIQRRFEPAHSCLGARYGNH